MHTFTNTPVPFVISFSDEELADLNRRLDTARWPKADIIPVTASASGGTPFGIEDYGPSLKWVQTLANEWRDDYSWREEEKKMNEFDHFKVEIEQLDIHFLHHKSSHASAIPLVLIHGWPGSYLEFLHVIPLLTNPPDGEQAFHVVVPSQPGFAFSSPPPSDQWKMEDTARIFDKLMTGLGYEKYAAQGGDWGSVTARILGTLHSDHCKAVHLNFCPAPPSPSFLAYIPTRFLINNLPKFLISDLERERGGRALLYLEKGSAYYAMQALTPRTAAYGLNDSPIGLLAWIGEKIGPFVNIAGGNSQTPTLTRKDILTACSLYWLTGTIGTSFLPYSLNPHFQTFLAKYYLPNFAMSVFPHEIAVVPEKWVRKTGNCGWYKDAEQGGHFAAIEEPALFSQHLRDAFTAIWKE